MISDTKVSYILLDNIYDSDIEGGINEDLSWNMFVKELSICHRRMEKGGLAFVPARFKDKNDWVLSDVNSETSSYKNDSNVQAISMIVFDLDKEGALDKAKELFKEFEYVIYSTHSYSRENPYKMRIVLPLAKEISCEQWRKAFDNIKYCIDADSQCRDFSRGYYFSSMPTDSDIEPYFENNNGNVLNYNLLKKATDTYFKNLSTDEQDTIKTTLKKENSVFIKRHFADGQVVQPASAKNIPMDFSYEGMKERHSSLINTHLKEGQNDAFALKVTYKDIALFGRDTNIPALIQFIARASMDFFDKNHILSKQSDTLNQLPKKIIGAIGKLAPDFHKSLSSDFKNNLDVDIARTKVIALQGKWEFPDSVSTIKSEQVNSVSFFENDVRNRLKKQCLELKASSAKRRSLNFITSSILSEKEVLGSEFKLERTVEFCIKQLQRYYTKFNDGNSVDDILEEEKNKLINYAPQIFKFSNLDPIKYKDTDLIREIKKGFGKVNGIIPWSDELSKDDSASTDVQPTY